jgi:RNA polymerase I-specific transcription initiation factor RRN7
MDFSFQNIVVRQKLANLPEVCIISLVVIATKLSQPLDDIIRTPEKTTDAAAMSIGWRGWRDSIIENSAWGFDGSSALNITEKDVFQMSDEKLDDYLSWFQKTWIDDKDPKSKLFPTITIALYWPLLRFCGLITIIVAQQILDLFPLEQVPRNVPKEETEDVTEQRLKHVQAQLKVRKSVSAEEAEYIATINRPGSYYTLYRKEVDLPEKTRAFFESAAEEAGISLDMLIRGVYRIERQLQEWLANEKREMRAEERANFEMEKSVDDIM